jgi:hypothetical protein
MMRSTTTASIPAPLCEFVPWARALYETDWPAHTHVVSNNTLEITGNVAHSENYFLEVLRRKDGFPDLRGGRYIDRLERRDGARTRCLEGRSRLE